MYAGDDYDVVVEVGFDATRVSVVIESADAPTEYAYDLSLAVGERIELPEGPNGVAVIRDAAGTHESTFMPAWAVDADGMDVPTWYEIDGSTLVQVVEHHGATYPVTADPTHTCGIVTCTVYFNRSETRTIASGTLGVGTLAAWCGLAGGPFAAAGCLTAAAILVTSAILAQNQGRCVSVKYLRSGTGSWTSTHNGNRCR